VKIATFFYCTQFRTRSVALPFHSFLSVNITLTFSAAFSLSLEVVLESPCLLAACFWLSLQLFCDKASRMLQLKLFEKSVPNLGICWLNKLKRDRLKDREKKKEGKVESAFASSIVTDNTSRIVCLVLKNKNVVVIDQPSC